MAKSSNAAAKAPAPAGEPVQAPKAINLTRYKPDYENALDRDTRPARIVHFLLWAGKEYPYEYAPVNVIAQAIFAFRNPPSMKSDHSYGVRASSGSVRRILNREHGRDLDLAGGGMRVTVNDDDQARVVVPKRARRLQSAKNAYVSSVELVDENKLKDPALKAYMKKSVREVLKLVSSESFDQKLLPPTTGE